VAAQRRSHDAENWTDNSEEYEETWADFGIPVGIRDANVQQAEGVEVRIHGGEGECNAGGDTRVVIQFLLQDWDGLQYRDPFEDV
jgi:hypothetical protein